ncbi:MAG: polysaccharide biosynthesis C-terminal domain-containing protein [Oscillospiraceae bacterium]|jgi:O-antigen/teichoic acid export membrane protein|nr:polysaccharide biosynthesis C-terminal domain-containing protein [Oscillospiraceae bacterium]
MKQILQHLPHYIKKITKQGFFHILVGNTLVKFISFFSAVLLPRILSKEEFGNLGFVDNIIGYILLFNAIGLANAVLRFCSTTDDTARKAAILRFCLKLGLAVDVVLAALMLPVVMFVPLSNFESARGVLIFSVFIPIASFMFDALTYYLRANYRNKEFSRISVIFTVVSALTQIVLALRLRVFGAFTGRYLGFIAASFLTFLIIKKHLSKTAEGAPLVPVTLKRAEQKSIIIFSLGAMLSSCFSLIMPLNEQFVVNYILREPILTANYKAASLLPQNLQFITMSIVVFIYPYFARNYLDGKWIWKHFKLVTIGLSAGIAMVALVGALLTPFLIHQIYGDKYNDIIGLMRFMWITFGINSALRMPAGNILAAMGEVKFNLIVAIISCAIHFVLDVLFISAMGMHGAAYALTLAYIISAAISVYFLYRRCKRVVAQA